jgi:hypothetical protein
VEEVVMIVPVYRHVNEAQDIGKKNRDCVMQRAQIGTVRSLQFKNHDSNDDGNHAVTECDKPLLFHPDPFSVTRCAPSLAEIASSLRA